MIFLFGNIFRKLKINAGISEAAELLHYCKITKEDNETLYNFVTNLLFREKIIKDQGLWLKAKTEI